MEMIAFCGINCADCPAYVATVNNDDNLREKTAKEWSKMFNADIKASDINCHGCHGNGEKLFSHCHVCEIRKCGIEKGIESTCAECKDYACKKLEDLQQYLPNEKKQLDELNKKLLNK